MKEVDLSPEINVNMGRREEREGEEGGTITERVAAMELESLEWRE